MLLREDVENFDNHLADLAEFRDPEASGRAGGRTEPDAGGYRRLFRIEWNSVLVAGDVRAAKRRFSDLSGQPFGPQVDQHEMRIGAAGHNIESVRFQCLGQGPGILDNVARIGTKAWP